MADTDRNTSPPRKKVAAADMEDDKSDANGSLFEVESIIGKSKFKGTLMYKVRWKGYGLEDDTWEPLENLAACQEIIDEYNSKLKEAARKRGEERKLKRLQMEGHLSHESSESSSESNSPYPATFKNTFWKELEAGRVNVFESDMYSSVKKRSHQHQSKKEIQENSDSSTKEGNSQSKKRRPTPNSRSSSRKNSQSGSQERRNLQETGVGSSSSRSRKNKNSAGSKKLDFQRIVVTTDSESESDYIGKAQKNDKENIEGRSSEERDLKKLVIKKIPQLSQDMNSKCSFMLQFSEDDNSNLSREKGQTGAGPDKESSENKLSVLDGHMTQSGASVEDSHGVKKRKKKHSKHHKHHKRKSEKSSSSSSRHRDSDRKRKVAATSLTSLPVTSSRGTEGKAPKLEQDTSLKDVASHRSSERLILEKSLDNVAGVADVAEKKRLSSECMETDVENSHLLNVKQKDAVIKPSPSSSLFADPISPIIRVAEDTSNNLLSFSNDLISGNTIRSQTNCVNKDAVNSPSYAGGLSEQVPLFGDIRTVGTKCELDRQDSETRDSGIASPASEKSVGNSRQDFVQPLEDILGKSVLPLMPDSEKTQTRGADHELDFDLDDMDWKLFDIEVKFEPTTLSNDEFASAVRRGDYELVKRAFLGEGKYDLEHPDASGKTLLMYTVQNEYDDIADLLIEHGADINSRMNSGLTPLMIACEQAELATVNLLLELGAKVNLQCQVGETALIKAAKRGHKQILWLLLECGASFNMVSHAGYTALSYAKLLHVDDTTAVITSHIHRVMSEFDRQVATTLNGSAKILSSLFSPQVYNVCEEERFRIIFKHSLNPQNHGVGYLLFIGHALFTSEEVKCRFYGPCVVKAVTLNGHLQAPLTQESNFVLAFTPLVDGKNEVIINTTQSVDMKAKLIVCAYKVQLLKS